MTAYAYMRQQAERYRQQAQDADRSDAHDTARDYRRLADWYAQAALALAARTKGVELETRG